jgi:hypothetical protein
MSFNVKHNLFNSAIQTSYIQTRISLAIFVYYCSCNGNIYNHFTIKNDVNSTAQETDCVKTKQMIIRQLLKPRSTPVQVPEHRKSQTCCSMANTLFNSEHCVIANQKILQ